MQSARHYNNNLIMRAGSDIGYCDSDHPKAPLELCEEDIKANVEALGFELDSVIIGGNIIELYLTDKDTHVCYDYYDLEQDIYKEFTRKDFLREWDQRFSGCCNADIIDDHNICKHCKESVL